MSVSSPTPPGTDPGAGIGPADARSAASSAYVPALDGVRAVAVGVVVAFHLGRLHGGFLGVDVFFVVSGFLITRLLLADHERSGALGLRTFWVRRFRRLIPALCVVVLAGMAGSRLWLPSWRLHDIRDDALSALAYVANWRFIHSGQSYFTQGRVSPFRHTWSLAIEEQFYVAWPLLVLGALVLGRRIGRRREVVLGTAGVLAAASAVWMAVVASDPARLARAYYGTDTRAFSLLIGAVAAAALWDPGRRGAAAGRVRSLPPHIGLVAAVPIVWQFIVAREDQQGFYLGGFQGFALCAVVLVVALAEGGGPLVAGLSWRPLVWLGRRSYGIYLWTWPIQVLASEGLGVEGWRLDAVVVSGGLALAALSFWLVEEPIRTGRRPRLHQATAPRRVHRPDRGPVLARGFGALAVVAVLTVALAWGAPQAPSFLRASDRDVLDAALRGVGGDTGPGTASSGDRDRAAGTPDPTTGPVGAGTSTTPDPVPVPGPFDPAQPLLVPTTAQRDPATVLGRPLRVLVLGDSVAWSVGWEVEERVPPGMVLSDRAIIGCGVMPVDARWIVGRSDDQPYGPLCPRQADAETLGAQWRPDVVLLWFGSWEVYDQLLHGVRYRVGSAAYARRLESQVQARIDRFRAQGAPTVLVDIPCFGKDVPRLGTERRNPRRLAWVDARIRALAERNRGWVRIIAPDDQLCTPDGNPRPTTPDGIPLRVDGTHFTPDSAEWFWRTWLAGQLGAGFDRRS